MEPGRSPSASVTLGVPHSALSLQNSLCPVWPKSRLVLPTLGAEPPATAAEGLRDRHLATPCPSRRTRPVRSGWRTPVPRRRGLRGAGVSKKSTPGSHSTLVGRLPPPHEAGSLARRDRLRVGGTLVARFAAPQRIQDRARRAHRGERRSPSPSREVVSPAGWA